MGEQRRRQQPIPGNIAQEWEGEPSRHFANRNTFIAGYDNRPRYVCQSSAWFSAENRNIDRRRRCRGKRRIYSHAGDQLMQANAAATKRTRQLGSSLLFPPDNAFRLIPPSPFQWCAIIVADELRVTELIEQLRTALPSPVGSV